LIESSRRKEQIIIMLGIWPARSQIENLPPKEKKKKKKKKKEERKKWRQEIRSKMKN